MPAASFNAGHPTSVSTAWWAGNIVVAYRTSAGHLYWTRSTGISAGVVTGWTPAVQLATNIVGEVELAVIPRKASINQNQSRDMWLVYLDGSTGHYHYYRTNAPAISWVPGAILEQLGSTTQGVSGAYGASLTPWPSVVPIASYANIETGCGAFPNAQGLIRILCLQRDDVFLRWKDVSSNVFLGGPSGISQPTTLGKPALAYHIMRQTSGANYYANYAGQFWLGFAQVVGGDARPALAISGRVINTQSVLNGTWFFPAKWVGRFHNSSARLTAGGGVELHSALGLGALKGAWIRRDATVPNPSIIPGVNFVPLADGSWNVQGASGNDWHVMEGGMCRGLLASTTMNENDAYCGAPGLNPWGF